MKRCPRCEEVLPDTEFGSNRQTPDGRMYYCKKCAAEKQRKFRAANPESAKASKQKYLDKLRARNDERAAS